MNIYYTSLRNEHDMKTSSISKLKKKNSAFECYNCKSQVNKISYMNT